MEKKTRRAQAGRVFSLGRRQGAAGNAGEGKPAVVYFIEAADAAEAAEAADAAAEAEAFLCFFGADAAADADADAGAEAAMEAEDDADADAEAGAAAKAEAANREALRAAMIFNMAVSFSEVQRFMIRMNLPH